MIKVGLSGNRYSGKNRVVAMFKQIGIPVFEADVILKFILQHNFIGNFCLQFIVMLKQMLF